MERKLIELIEQDAECRHFWTPEKSGIHEMEIGYFLVNFSATYHDKEFTPNDRMLPTESNSTTTVEIFDCYDEEGDEMKLTTEGYNKIERFIEMNLFRV